MVLFLFYMIFARSKVKIPPESWTSTRSKTEDERESICQCASFRRPSQCRDPWLTAVVWLLIWRNCSNSRDVGGPEAQQGGERKKENRRGGDREKPVEEEDGADPDKDLLWILVEQFKEEVRELKDLLTEKDKELSRLGGAERRSGEPKKRRARQPTTAWRDPKAGERALRQERDQSAGGQGEQTGTPAAWGAPPSQGQQPLTLLTRFSGETDNSLCLFSRTQRRRRTRSGGVSGEVKPQHF